MIYANLQWVGDEDSMHVKGWIVGNVYDGKNQRENFQQYYNDTFSPNVQTVFITDFRVRGNNYYERKDYARQLAMDIQSALSGCSISWYEIALIEGKMYDIGKRYGLLDEFRENGIC